MRHGMTIDEFLEKLNRDNSEKVDYITDARSVSISEDSRLITVDGAGEFSPTPIAHDQIASKTGIPTKYYNRLMESHPDLLAKNVNTLLERDNSRYMVRTLGTSARAFLSDRYQRLDNMDVIKATLPVMRAKNLRITDNVLTESHMYLKTIWEEGEVEIERGDSVIPGLFMSNSEVGRGALTLELSLWRRVCENLHIVKEGSQRRVHLGIRQEDTAFLSSNTIAQYNRAIVMAIADGLGALTSHQYIQHIVDRLRTSKGQALATNKPISEVVKLAASTLLLTQEEEDLVLENLIRSMDYTRYGFSNAITATAKELNNYDRSIELERIGWNVVDMPANSWQRIAA